MSPTQCARTARCRTSSDTIAWQIAVMIGSATALAAARLSDIRPAYSS